MDAEASIKTAEEGVAAAIEQARSQGMRAAEARMRTQLIASERAARMLVLDAQREVEAVARTRAIAEALAFRERPEYHRLLDNLEANAKRRLGSAAEIERDPPDCGGIRARVGNRSLDYTLTSLAAHVLDDVFAAIEAPAEPTPTPRSTPR